MVLLKYCFERLSFWIVSLVAFDIGCRNAELVCHYVQPRVTTVGSVFDHMGLLTWS